MANFKTDLADRAGKLGTAGLVDGALANGSLMFTVATVTLPSSTATNDTIDITPALPAGATVVPTYCRAVCHADPGTTLVLDIGDAADPDRYADGLVLSAGGDVPFHTPAIPAGSTSPLKFTTDTAITALVSSASTITASSKITFYIAYLVIN
jgi:hypothetical protein